MPDLTDEQREAYLRQRTNAGWVSPLPDTRAVLRLLDAERDKVLRLRQVLAENGIIAVFSSELDQPEVPHA